MSARCRCPLRPPWGCVPCCWPPCCCSECSPRCADPARQTRGPQQPPRCCRSHAVAAAAAVAVAAAAAAATDATATCFCQADKNYGTALKQGLQWQIIRHEVEDRWPHLQRFLQEAANATQSISEAETRDEIMKKAASVACRQGGDVEWEEVR